MKRICAYCGKHLATVPDSGEFPDAVSHGLCSECVFDFMAGTGEPFVDFLDTLGGPVFVVDDDGRILGANAKGQELVSASLGDMRGRLGGEVFQCTNAAQPGGCGRTVHCRTCTVRICVEKTFETGTPCVKVPATLDLAEITGARTIRFLITTKKAGAVVLLHIEDLEPAIAKHLCLRAE